MEERKTHPQGSAPLLASVDDAQPLPQRALNALRTLRLLPEHAAGRKLYPDPVQRTEMLRRHASFY